MSRRSRISIEDRALWDRAVAGARPLRAEAGIAPPARSEAASASAPPAAPAPHREPPRAPVPPAGPDRSRAQMDRRRFEKLRRGRLEPEARLDLHGMSLERAHAALAGFVAEAHSAGLRLVLVITGKGRAGEGPMAPQRRGLLRHSVPHWLAAPSLAGRILQIEPAHPRHGGAGALYVYLRRAR